MDFSEIILVSSLSPGCEEGEIISICDASIRSNSSNNLGGILLYAHGSFMQLIEGDSQGVTAAYKRITQSPWHFNIHVLLSQEMEERLCGAWSFSHVPLGKKIDRISESSPHFFPFKKKEIKERVQKGNARDLLKGFIENNR
jgi:Sensors of blue-light using FAD